jgi:hypothetical protein
MLGHCYKTKNRACSQAERRQEPMNPTARRRLVREFAVSGGHAGDEHRNFRCEKCRLRSRRRRSEIEGPELKLSRGSNSTQTRMLGQHD